MKRVRWIRTDLAQADGRKGSVLVVTLVTVATLAIFGLALLTAGLSGTKSVNHYNDDYRLSSAVESVAILAADNLWSSYWASPMAAQVDGGSITNFRTYLDSIGVADNGLGGPPQAAEGEDLLAIVGVPGAVSGNPEFNNVNIDALQVFRRDVNDSTQLYLTVSASTNRGSGIVNPILNRAVQQVYTIEPTLFDGFDYGILSNNVNCIFCHTQVDSVDRFFSTDPLAYGTFDRVKVGTLESLMLRHNMDGAMGSINDYDADSVVAGTIYTRGSVTDHAGLAFTSGDWANIKMGSFEFDSTGKIVQDGWGGTTITPLSPAGTPPQPLENLYQDYSQYYNQMVDGGLPSSFPPPIADDGGIDPITGMPSNAGKGNKVVDNEEFFAASLQAEGAITAGFINVTAPGDPPITTVPQYSTALTAGNLGSINRTVAGSVILTGTLNNPITIDGTIAIDGDVIINGYVKGTGSLIVRGNVYVPTDMQYLDGVDANGNRTFGIAPDGVTENKLAISAGGSIMIGDYLRPTSLTPIDPMNLVFGWSPPSANQKVSGDSSAQGTALGKWSFSLAEISLFNRGEWMKTQPMLPGDAMGTLVANPHYVPPHPVTGDPYVPRYYSYGPGDAIPIYNGGSLYFDTVHDNWVGDFEVPMEWDPALVTDASTLGTPFVNQQISPTGGWITEDMYKVSVNYFVSNRPVGKPLQVDALLYTNNAIFGIVNRLTSMMGQMQVNGALVCADLGMLLPGLHNPAGFGTSLNVPGSKYLIGLRLNYDRRLRNLLNIANPNQVVIKRTLWNPTANIL